MKLSEQASWNAYWKDNSGNTFANSYSKNDPLGQIIKPYFSTAFEKMRKHEKILDVGSGMGAHFAFLESSAPQSTVIDSIKGVDFAIEQDITLAKDRVVYKGDITSLKYPRDSFTSLSAIFAIEYAPVDAALQSITACLANAANIALLLHRPKSVICEKSGNTITFYNRLFADGFDELLIDLPNAVSVKEIEAKLLKLLLSLNKALGSQYQHDLSIVANACQAVLVRHAGNKAVCFEKLLKYAEQLRSHENRLAQQLAAANNSAAVVSAWESKSAQVFVNEEVQSEFGLVGHFFHAQLR